MMRFGHMSVNNHLLEAHENLKDSCTRGILPDIQTSFELANKELKDRYSKNDQIQRGFEIVQESIDSYLSVSTKDNDNSFSNIKEALDQSILDGSFIPETKVSKVVSDISSI
mmetsp:Transcript_28263/g.24976  ORF Transcript_28263/g.24976 Transcript_28263/m.24976 type:complete len:112 (+) Transcript_28263:301-636(+)